LADVTVPSPSEQILAWLRAATSPLSGEVLAERLGISRAAVFKHVEALRTRGYTIASEHAQGYVLAATPDRLDVTELGPHLTGTWRRIEWHAAVDSTQRRARELGQEGADEGTVVTAEAQTAGRGRLGRTWHSPPGRNLYCSILLPPARSSPGSSRSSRSRSASAWPRRSRRWGSTRSSRGPTTWLLDWPEGRGILTELEAELERVRLRDRRSAST
jgi:BirA family biotin operon repressor/biotin-[acetyl-CoA-carboxylase] ligase